MVVDVIYDWDSGIFCSEGTVVEAELLKKRKSCNNALFHLKIRIENAQYPALKVTDINLAMYGITKIPPKLTISNAKVEIYSELGYGILEQETGVHSQKIDGKWVDDVHTELVDNLEIYNSTVIVLIGADAKSIAVLL